MTTTLLGLRKYLEQRGATIPAPMVAGWLGLGAGLIVAFLAVAAVLPRPHSETAWFGMSRAGGGKSERNASRFNAVPDESAGKGEGAQGRKTEAGDGKGSAKGGKQGGGKGGEKGQGGGKGKDGGGEAKGGKSGGKSEQGKQSGDDRSDSQSKQQQDDQKSDGRDPSQQKGAEERRGGPQERQQKQSESQKSNSDQQKDASEKSQDEASSQKDNSSSFQKMMEAPSRVLSGLQTVIKWVVYAAIVLAILYAAVRYGVGWLANFTDWARNLLDWWRNLFARKPGAGGREADDEPADDGPTRPPFDSFSNPFADGTARRRSPADVVAYTFAALDAWAWERGRGRQPGETPTEFAIRLGHEEERLDEPGFQLAELYVRALYAKGQLPADALKTARAVWDTLAAVPAGRR